ncbi:MAG: iron-sulfur cluster repair di-iron protein, ric [Eubacteriales bacterium]|jgi:regulator of cell morphogenesis and NO signaling|nr:iron-sulfur cluster repair di-iron protein, ric [Eubacteriales bacterium]MDD3289567.1 iron-sulfur cluster repair di-iron protein, ric [Eubacteriales bacterium]MDD3863390.1 iron-sulfur cluster repair di-iron protein, ric [Eubacteriales bacterium]MDD4445002.1 iron-sulfur cluster repair di-iron protein, ric [Eubacteriales bacterium]
MKSNPAFGNMQKKHFKTLIQYVPIVARVHGGTHPEFHEVRRIFDSISQKVKENSPAMPDLTQEFAKLREITTNYTIPMDVCESYEAVYSMLAELDSAYQESKSCSD